MMDDSVTTQKYRANVGIMIINRQGEILAGEVLDSPGEWMMPQGGIDLKESTHQAMQRELFEETGLSLEQAIVIHEHDEWLDYLFRQPQYKDDVLYIGQRQKWFLLSYNGAVPDATKVLDPEFTEFQWVQAKWLVGQISALKKPVYQTVFSAFSEHFPKGDS